jgi:uncharacterized protein YjbI with pentapeptide repeats
LGESCQFAGEFAEGNGLVDIAGHWFCLYHLPFNEADFAAMTQVDVALSGEDKARLKSEWSTDRQEAFNQAILSDKVAPARQAQVLCDLTGVVFPGNFVADGLVFPAVSFVHARFSGGNASFDGALFSGGAAWFENAQFSGGDTWFSRAQFSGGVAVFDGAQFSGGVASFENARFAGFASFTAPRHDARARQGQDPGDFDFSHVRFRSASFEGSVTFENRRFSGRTSFTNARFAKAPEFHGCALHQDTVFPAMENFGGREGEEAARAYRTLKLAMGQHRATAEEAMFWALEQITTRSTLKPLQRPRDIMPWLLSASYEAASFYGLSVTRPLLLFLVSTLIVFPLYVYQPLHEFAVSGLPSDGITLREIADAVSFSMRQVVRPFDIWSRYDLDALKLLDPAASEQTSYLGTKLIATGQSVVSLALVTLFLLALRRRFRMV